LSDLGRREDALAAIQEAVEHYRRLAQARPDAFLPDLATSLNNQSNRLSELGRREDALAAIQEAVTIRRRLAQARPDAFLPDVAMSLYNLALRHAQDGAGGALALARAHEAVSAYAVLSRPPRRRLPRRPARRDRSRSHDPGSARRARRGRRRAPRARRDRAAIGRLEPPARQRPLIVLMTSKRQESAL
jgi:tetratricopeptide (TPR) repeat protein